MKSKHIYFLTLYWYKNMGCFQWKLCWLSQPFKKNECAKLRGLRGCRGFVGPWVRALVGVRGLRCLVGSWVRGSKCLVGPWVRGSEIILRGFVGWNCSWVRGFVKIARGSVGWKILVGPKNPRGSEIFRGSKNSSWVQNFFYTHFDANNAENVTFSGNFGCFLTLWSASGLGC